MFTDIVGFSRQMGADETRMLRLLEVHNHLIEQTVADHYGQVIKSTGDGFLVEFPSVVNAVQCAQRIQRHLRARNAQTEPSEQIHLRIGVHLGDIVQHQGDVQGDGVNIAARLQPLAEPDTICISQQVYEEVAKKLPLGRVMSLGRPKLKNIAHRFLVYVLLPEQPTGLRQTLGIQWLKLTRRISTAHRVIVAAFLLALAGAGTLAIQHGYFRSTPRLLLPDKPSIAVLPFVNMSSDPAQEYFSDGMTDTLITDLSKLAGLFVIARNSTFAYKGKAIKPQQVSQELGVRYVLEGSVQKAEARVRINAQLVDATTGRHLWAERYDRELQDIFTLQDELTRRIVGALQVKLTAQEQGRLGRVPTENLEAYDYYLRGKADWERGLQEANGQARHLFEHAIALDPQFALAYTVLGLTYLREWLWGWSYDPHTLDQAVGLAQKAHALDDTLPEAHMVLGLASAFKGQPEQGLVEGERAIALDPNCAWCHSVLAEVLLVAGQPEEALGLVEKAMRLDPEPASAAYYAVDLGWAYRSLGRYEEALTTLKRALTHNPEYLPAHIHLAGLYNELGREAEARAAEAAARRLNPNVPLEALREKTAVKKQETEPGSFFARSSAHLKALGYLVSGSGYYYRLTPEGNAQARQLFERATELDPQFAWAYTGLGYTYMLEWFYQWSPDPQTLERALALARRALALDDASPMAHQLLSTVYLLKAHPERAVVEAERAIALDPEDAEGYFVLGLAYIVAGRPEDGIGVLQKGLGLKPRFPASFFSALGLAYRLLGRQEDALDAQTQAVSHTPNLLMARWELVVLYSALGREEEARAEVGEIRRLSPKFSVEGMRQVSPFTDPAETERIVAALREAGLK
ncbi:MAG TPA: tetratricopeptide repeat protein [Candidatus Binatia bacterium]|nr:tetratricopeptide repeat protein [Candidatus Binatia bacterium]